MKATISLGRLLLLGSALSSLACGDVRSLTETRSSLGAMHQGLRVEEAVIGPEMESGVPVPVPALMWAQSVDLTTDGSGFFVVAPSRGYLRGSRLDPQGNPVGWDWSVYGESATDRQTVAFGAGHFLVIQEQDGFTGQLIGKDGQLEGAPFSLGLSGFDAQLAWNGQNFGLTYDVYEDGERSVRFALLDPQGRVLVSEVALPLSFISEPPRVAASRGRFLVTWVDVLERVVYACPIGFDGRAEQSPVELASGRNFVGRAAVASNGEQFFVTWAAMEEGGLISQRGAILDEAGALLVPEFEISGPEEALGAPAAASDGADFIAAWLANRDDGVILGSRVSASGNVSTPRVVADLAGFYGFLGTDSSRELQLAYNGADYVLAMNTFPGLFGALFGADLTPKRSGLTLRTVANDQANLQVVWDGTAYNLSWIDVAESSWWGSARGTRITPNGEHLEPAVHSLSGENQTVSNLQTASAGNGESLTLFQVDAVSAWYSKSNASGQSTPPTLLAADAVLCGTLVASDGAGYLATYCRPIVGSVDEFGNAEFAAWVAIFDRNANFLRTFPLAIGKNSQIERVLAVGSGYLVLFNDGQLKMARLNQAGEVIYVEPFPDGSVNSVGGARGASNTLVLFYQDDWKVHGRFYGDMGWLGDAFALPDEVEPWCPVAFDGTDYWVGWSLSEEGIRLMNITEHGELGLPFGPVADGWGPELAGSPHGQVLLSYNKFNWDSSSSRIVSRLISGASPLPAGGGGGASGGADGGPMNAGAGEDSGSSQAGSFSWPDGLGPLPSCAYATGSRPSRGVLLSLLAGFTLLVSRGLTRRKRTYGGGPPSKYR